MYNSLVILIISDIIYDILLIYPQEFNLIKITDRLNNIESNIKFTHELEIIYTYILFGKVYLKTLEFYFFELILFPLLLG